MRGGCARRIEPPALRLRRRLVASRGAQAVRWVPALRWCASLRRACVANRIRRRVALSTAGSSGLRPSRAFSKRWRLLPTVPASGAPRSAAIRRRCGAAPRDRVVVEEWRSIATNYDLKLRAPPARCQAERLALSDWSARFASKSRYDRKVWVWASAPRVSKGLCSPRSA